MIKTFRIIVKGKVQGVNYRQATRNKALTLNLSGNVKNLNNGDVEIIVTGEAEPVDELHRWCLRGPVAARVDEVNIEPLPLQDFNGFSVLRNF